MNRAFRWLYNINLGIKFAAILSTVVYRVDVAIKRTSKAWYAIPETETKKKIEISTSLQFQMLGSHSILILFLALASALQPQELSIEDIVKGRL